MSRPGVAKGQREKSGLSFDANPVPYRLRARQLAEGRPLSKGGARRSAGTRASRPDRMLRGR
jgi:hypothetical protein